MRTATFGLGPFLDELDRRLSALGSEEVRQVLLDHAEGLPASQRAAFLEIFRSAERNASTRRAAAEPPAKVVPDEDAEALLADIDAFAESVREGTYFEGWGWDHELHEERAFGDESWVSEMDSLFEAAGAAFVDGDLELARDAYAKLLEAFSLDEEVGTFCGDRSATQMVETDLGEAKARYLRAIYETTPAPERAALLVETLDELDYLGPPASLEAVVDTRRAPLPGLDAFLPAWIEALAAVPQGGYGFAREARRLLAEAAALHGGAVGLADLARRPGPNQAEAYLDWVDHLARDGQPTEAMAAAREGLAAIPSPGEARARLAERLADLGQSQGDEALALEGCRQAWRAAPSVTRLLGLARACPEAHFVAVLEEEALLLNAPPARQGAKGASPGAKHDRAACALLLAAGRVRDAGAVLKDAAPSLGWSSPDHPGPVVLPYLLVAASGRSAPPTEPGSLLAELFAAVDTPDWAVGLDPNAWRGQVPGSKIGEPNLAELLVRSIEALAPSPAERRRLLDQARAVIEERVAAIVEAQHRGAYRRAASLFASGESSSGHHPLDRLARVIDPLAAASTTLGSMPRVVGGSVTPGQHDGVTASSHQPRTTEVWYTLGVVKKNVIERISQLLDSPLPDTANTSMRIPTTLREAAALAVKELGVAPSATALTAAALRAALEAIVMQAALDDHYQRHPEALPDLGDLAVAAAEMDGNPLAANPELVRRAAIEIAQGHPGASPDDVLLWAEAKSVPVA